jgi:hypothetical protein
MLGYIFHQIYEYCYFVKILYIARIDNMIILRLMPSAYSVKQHYRLLFMSNFYNRLINL